MKFISRLKIILKDVSGIGFTYFDDNDIVRHPLVKKIIGVYDKIKQNDV